MMRQKCMTVIQSGQVSGLHYIHEPVPPSGGAVIRRSDDNAKR